MAIRGVDALLDKIEKTKSSLNDVDKTIARLTGRDPAEPSPRGRQRPPRVSDEGRGRSRERLFVSARRSLGDQDGGPPNKRRAMGGAFSRLGPRVIASRVAPPRDMDSGDEDEVSGRPAVQSSVVATPTTNRSREDVAESQSKDKESKGRNRRMFGLLLGTLQRFKDEEKTKGEKEKLRKAVEERLEEKEKTEQLEVRKERRKLFVERQLKEQKIKSLEQKMELVKIHEQWADMTQLLGNFIRTKAKPHVYYIPKQHTSSTRDRQNQTKELLEKIIKDRKKTLEEEIDELTHEDESKAETDDRDDTKHSHEKAREHMQITVTNEAVNPERVDGEGEGEEAMDDGNGEGDVDNKENMDVEEEQADIKVEVKDDSSHANRKEQGEVEEGQVEVAEAQEEGEVTDIKEANEVESKDKESDRKKRSSRKRTHSRRESESHDDKSRRESGEKARRVSGEKSRRESGEKSRRESGERSRKQSGERSRKESGEHSQKESGERPRRSSESHKKIADASRSGEGDKRTVISDAGVDSRTVQNDDSRKVLSKEEEQVEQD